jgi:hypothetical protein
MEAWIAYPGDRPPEVVDMPSGYDFRGHVWRYVPATPQAASEALAEVEECWADWVCDPRLAAIAHAV